MRARLDEADRFTGLPRGTAKPFSSLPFLSRLSPISVCRHTPPSWSPGWCGRPSRRIGKKAAGRSRRHRPSSRPSFSGGMSPRAVQNLNRRLWEAGIFVIRDDPQGRRYKYRDERTGRLTKAFGFDLSPLALRYDEFKKSPPTPRSNATACVTPPWHAAALPRRSRNSAPRATTAKRIAGRAGEGRSRSTPASRAGSRRSPGCGGRRAAPSRAGGRPAASRSGSAGAASPRDSAFAAQAPR